MAIMKYNFPEIEEMPGFRIFQDTVNRFLSEPAAARPWVPAVDVFETDNEVLLKADIPGVDMKDVDIRLENGTLTLRGQRRFEQDTKNGGYHRIERSYGAFVRYFTLPETVDAEKVRAEFKDGVLAITLPKKEVAKPKQIKVEIHSNN